REGAAWGGGPAGLHRAARHRHHQDVSPRKAAADGAGHRARQGRTGGRPEGASPWRKEYLLVRMAALIEGNGGTMGPGNQGTSAPRSDAGMVPWSPGPLVPWLRRFP